MTKTSKLKSGAWRSRWAALGAAVAVSVGAGGMVMVSAAPTAPSSFQADTPVRILDTRTDVGLSGPFVSGVAQTLQVTGSVPTQPPNGVPAVNAVAVPSGATSVVLNVTVVGPTTGGFLSIRPGTSSGVPATSNINWGAGGPNIANSVTVQLPDSGNINIYVQGTVREVLIDVAGYYTPAESTSGVTMEAFEVQMSFGETQAIATNEGLTLNLACRIDDTTPTPPFEATPRNNMQFIASSAGPKFMTTFVDAVDLYENEGVTIARALGSSTPPPGTMVQTTFLARAPSGGGPAVRTAASMTGADGSQIAVDGDSVQVMFNVDDQDVTGQLDPVDCYARGFVTLLPPR